MGAHRLCFSSGRVRLGTGGRLDRQPAPNSLGLLPSGPDPVGEGCVCRQSPTLFIAETPADDSPKF